MFDLMNRNAQGLEYRIDVGWAVDPCASEVFHGSILFWPVPEPDGDDENPIVLDFMLSVHEPKSGRLIALIPRKRIRRIRLDREFDDEQIADMAAAAEGNLG